MRMVYVTLVLMPLILVSGCASEGYRDEPLVITAALDQTSITKNTARNAYDVVVLVHVKWGTTSSGHKINVPTAGNYLVLAYERGGSFVPVTIVSTFEQTRRQPSIPGELLDGAAEGALKGAAPFIFVMGIVTAPAWLPFYVHYRPRDLPENGYLWVEDTESGEVIAGNSPWTVTFPVGKNPSSPSVQTAPRSESDYMVNCAVAGERKWTWRSLCD
jgi:hypothetical protein